MIAALIKLMVNINLIISTLDSFKRFTANLNVIRVLAKFNVLFTAT